jgi:hypothetical protein
VNRAAKQEIKEAQTEKALLDTHKRLLQAKSARTIVPQNNDEEVLMELFN